MEADCKGLIYLHADILAISDGEGEEIWKVQKRYNKTLLKSFSCEKFSGMWQGFFKQCKLCSKALGTDFLL